MGMKVISYIILVVLVVLTAGGCAFKSISHGTEITEEQMARIINDKTTKQDIFIEFGNPSRTMDNERVFFYNWTRGSKSAVLGIGGGSAYTHSLVIVFDENGVVKNHKITRGATEAGVNVTDQLNKREVAIHLNILSDFWGPPLSVSLYKKMVSQQDSIIKLLSKGGNNDLKKCPACAEMIKVEARKCCHCGEQFSLDDINAAIEQNKLLIEKKSEVYSIVEVGDGEAFCFSCKKSSPMQGMYRDKNTDRYYHESCMPADA